MIRRRPVLIALMLMSFAGTAWGSPVTPVTPALSAADQALVDQAAHYLNGLTSAEGRFVQTDAAGRKASGAFWIQRPGRARFDYDAPSGLAMASDGRLVSVVNHRLKTIQSYPLGMTPLSIFLAKDVHFTGNVVVRQVKASANALTIEAADRRAPSRGRVSLIFAREPLALTGWSLTDARGQTVDVAITKLERSAPRPKAFFDIYDPSLHGPRPGETTPLD